MISNFERPGGFAFPALLGHSFVLPICCAVVRRALRLLGLAVFGSVLETSAKGIMGTEVLLSLFRGRSTT